MLNRSTFSPAFCQMSLRRLALALAVPFAISASPLLHAQTASGPSTANNGQRAAPAGDREAVVAPKGMGNSGSATGEPKGSAPVGNSGNGAATGVAPSAGPAGSTGAANNGAIVKGAAPRSMSQERKDDGAKRARSGASAPAPTSATR